MHTKFRVISAVALAISLGGMSSSVFAMGCLNPNLPQMGLTVDLLKPNAAVGMADYDKVLAEGNKCPVTQQSVSSNTAQQDNLFNSSATTSSSRQQYSN